MPSKETILEKSAHVLLDKAEDLAALADAQRSSADKQYENAHKLEKLGHALEDGAADLQVDLTALEKARETS